MDRRLYLVLDGAVDVLMPTGVRVGTVQAGDVVGEVSMLGGLPHSATAVASRASRLIVLAHPDFEALTLRYPRIGMRVLNNIARSLGNKLKATDEALTQRYGADPLAVSSSR